MSTPQIYWTLLSERTIDGHVVDAALDIAFVAARRDFARIAIPYMRTDMARNRAAQSFMEIAGSPDDALVMLDCDHIHPHDILTRLAAHDPALGVVGALYFRRGEPYDPLFFRRDDEGILRNPAEWEPGCLYECDAVGTGGVLIRRWVFEELTEAGCGYPWFQYAYPPKGSFSMTEDIFFAEQCEKAGIYHYCDTSIITPHLGIQVIGPDTWDAYKKARPDILVDPVELGQEVDA